MRLVYAALAWCGGILFAAQFDHHTYAPWLFLALSYMAALLVCWRWRTPRLVFLLALITALGGLRFAVTPASTPIASYNGQGGLTVEGVVTNDPTARGSGLRFVLSADTISRAGQTHATSGLILVEVPFGYSATYGARIRATGELFRPPSFDTFSYADFLARSGIFSQMPNATVEIITLDGQSNLLQGILFSLRDQAASNINRALPEPYAGLLNGALLGDESTIAPAIQDAYATTGAAHVIAISGYNMVVISGILLAILGKTRIPRGAQAWIVIAIIALYTVFVGASASVVRAALMSGLLIVGERIIRRKTFVPASLAFATLLMSLQSPYVLWDIGFQLSLFATLGIVLFASPMTRWTQRQLERIMPENRAQTLAGILESGLLVSLAAQALTLPLIALYFERFSLVSLPVNFVIAPVQPFVLILGGIAVLIAFVSATLAQPLFLATLLPLAWTTSIVRGAAALPFAEVVIRLQPDLIAAFFVIIVGGAMLHATQPDWLLRSVAYVRRRPVFIATILTSSTVVVLLGALLFGRPDGRLHLWLLNMGHSHAVLIQSPQGAHALIDGGRFPSRLLLALGDRLPYTDRTLEAVILTQPDEFDYAALPEVFTRYQPSVIITNGRDNPGRSYTALRDSWGETPVVNVTTGYTIQLDGETRLQVLHPASALRTSERLNDDSLMLRLIYRDVAIMIPGDANQSAQAQVIASEGDITSDVMIMPQHGTVASLNDAFLEAVAPQMLLLQVDPANRLGDPNEDTLAKVAGIPLYSTDEGGTIHVMTDGETIQVEYEG